MHIFKKILFLVGVLMFSTEMTASAQRENVRHALVSEFIHDYIAIKYPHVVLDTFLYVGVERQEMYFFCDGELAKVYDVSTSKKGAGSEYGSLCTPVGLHRIEGKFGDGVPSGGVFVGRKFTGRVAQIEEEPVETGKDEITSRVITIRGLEDGVNRGGEFDSYKRKIYIHGTAEEGLIGQPASHGCIRMRNMDVIELFSILPKGTPLIILNN